MGAGRCISIGIRERVTQVFYERKRARREWRGERSEEGRGEREEERGVRNGEERGKRREE